MPLVELQPDGRFISNVHHVQEGSSNCKMVANYHQVVKYCDEFK